MPSPVVSATVTFNAKRQDNSAVFPSPLTATAANRSLAEANLQQQITDRITTAQGNVDELNSVNGLFNS